MTLGEHLDELRGCVLRSLIAVALACLVWIWPARYALAVLVRPVVLALRAHGQPESLLATGPAENILVYFKVVLIAGLVLPAGPYVIYQLWKFVAAGLYEKERAWVRRLVWPSLLLFVAGVAFMYLFVLVISLNFLVGFSNWLPLPRPQPSAFERRVLGLPAPGSTATQPAPSEWPTLPLLERDPPDPPPGAVWFNVPESRLKVHQKGETYSYQLQRDDRRAMVTTHFRIGEYLTFVLLMTIAFGLAFQMPLVVLFLVRSGLVSVEQLRKYRKVIIVLLVFIAGMLSGPDLLSHLFLICTMIALFEIGLWLARRARPKPAGS